jgi:hypothetical protein
MQNLQVRVAGLSGLVALCQLLPRDAQVAHTLPLVRRHMQPLELALPLQRALASAFPELLTAVSTPAVIVAGGQWQCRDIDVVMQHCALLMRCPQWCRGQPGLCRSLKCSWMTL